MEQKYFKQQSTFKISKPYKTMNSDQSEVSVFLIVNYDLGTFDILNESKLKDGGKFKFNVGTQQSVEMWRAVSEAIKDAVEIANQELFNPTQTK